MDGISINIKRTLSMQFLLDIMITMVETPYGDWWHFTDVNRRDEDLMITDFTVCDVGEVMDEPAHEIMEYLQTCDRVTITPQKVADAIELIMSSEEHYVSNYIEAYIARAVADDDAGDIDAIAADCLLQLAVNGEVMYG